MSRVLVTGGTGYIGSRVVDGLLGRGHDVHVVSRHPIERSSPAKWHQADLLVPGDSDETVRQIAAEALVHMAWYATPGQYWTSRYNLHWVEATLRIVRAFAEHGSRVLVSGTCAEYDLRYGFCREFITPTEPTTLYGIAKHATHELLEAGAQDLGIELSWARIFYLYGPGEPPQKLVSAIVNSILASSVAEVGSGSRIRDYLHVDDVASALVSILESGVAGPVNVGSGVSLTISEIASRIGALMGRSDLIGIGMRPDPPSDFPAIVADVTRLRDEVGWQPSMSIDEGLSHTIDAWSGVSAS